MDFSLILTLLLVPGLILVHHFIISPYRRMRQYKEKGIPNLYFFPLLGIMYYMYRDFFRRKDSLYFLKQFVKNYPDAKFIVSNWGTTLYFIMIDPGMIRDLVVKNIEKTRADHTNTFDPMLGDQSIVFSEGEGWNKRRKLHSYGYTLENLKKLTPMMIDIADKNLSQIGKDKNKDAMNVLLSLFTMTGEFMQTSILGSKTQDIKIGGMPLVNYQFYIAEFLFQRMLSLPFFIFGKKYYNHALFGNEKKINDKAKLLRKVITDEIESVKAEDMKNVPGKEMKLLDFWIQSMEKKEDLKKSDIDLTSEFIILVGTGVELTSHYILSCLLMLNDHPEVLKKLRQELDENITNENEFTYDKIDSLQYLSAFMKEVLRMGHPSPLGTMKQLDMDCMLGEYSFKKDMICLNGFGLNCMKEKYFKNPEEFRPERWLKDGVVQESINDESMSFIPFSIGPRSCIGSDFALMESKIVVTKFVTRFDFEVLTKPIQWRFAVTYGPSHPVLFKLKPL